MNEPQMKLPGLLTVLGIVGLVAILGWMGERDSREHINVMKEAKSAILHQREVIQVLAAECAPGIELSMPIDTRGTHL